MKTDTLKRGDSVRTVPPSGPTFDEIIEYRRQRRCSLDEACRALGYVGWRIERVLR